MTVSSTTTLGEVKLRLIEVLGLHPSNAALYVRGALVEGDGRTLAGAASHPGNVHLSNVATVSNVHTEVLPTG